MGSGCAGSRRQKFGVAISGKRSVPHNPQRTSRHLPGTHFKRRAFASHKLMNSRICICCGEPMPEEGNARSRNPNICASCSSMADGMEDSTECEIPNPVSGQALTSARTEVLARNRRGEETEEPAVHHGSL